MITRFAGSAPREARAPRPPRVAAWRAAALALAGLVGIGVVGGARAQDPSGDGTGISATGSAYAMHAGATPPFPALGERVGYHGWIAVERDTRVRWSAPDTGGVFTWGALRSGRTPLARRRAGGPWPADSVWVESSLQVFATGQVTVPGLGFTLEPRQGGPSVGRLPTVRLGIPPQIAADDTAADLRPPRGPLAAPWWERVPWRPVAGVAAILALAIVLYRRWRRRPRVVPAVTPVPARRRDPAAEALGDLAALRRMMLLEAGRFDEHAQRLSRILRRYLEATLGALRPGDSTPELLQRLEAGLLGADDVGRLRSLLRRWDGIKFARFPSDLEEGRRCEESVRELVLRTSQRRQSEVA